MRDETKEIPGRFFFSSDVQLWNNMPTQIMNHTQPWENIARTREQGKRHKKIKILNVDYTGVCKID